MEYKKVCITQLQRMQLDLREKRYHKFARIVQVKRGINFDAEAGTSGNAAVDAVDGAGKTEKDVGRDGGGEEEDTGFAQDIDVVGNSSNMEVDTNDGGQNWRQNQEDENDST